MPTEDMNKQLAGLHGRLNGGVPCKYQIAFMQPLASRRAIGFILSIDPTHLVEECGPQNLPAGDRLVRQYSFR
jgi:hypothetical protein